MSQDAKYVTLTDANFAAEVLQSDLPVLVDFGQLGVALAALLPRPLNSLLRNTKAKQ